MHFGNIFYQQFFSEKFYFAHVNAGKEYLKTLSNVDNDNNSFLKIELKL